MKITKSQLKELIQEELQEIVGLGTGSEGHDQIEMSKILFRAWRKMNDVSMFSNRLRGGNGEEIGRQISKTTGEAIKLIDLAREIAAATKIVESK